MNGVNVHPYQDWARETLGFEFEKPEYLVTAFTHRSYVNEHKKSATAHNERQEFLGDAVLELVVTDFLFNKYKDLSEGILTAIRAALVRTESIRDAGIEMGYEKLIRTSKGEKKATDNAKKHIIANCFEALIGGIYLEKGYDAAKKVIEDYILVKADEIVKTSSWRDAKSHLQELSQRHHDQTPEYRILTEDGPDHNKIFKIGVFVDGKNIGEGTGSSKQKAQQEAATKAIEHYMKNVVKLKKKIKKEEK